MNLTTLKIRAYFAWHILTGRYEPAKPTPLTDAQKVKHEALKLALEALQNLGKRQHGGSVSARSAYAFITTQLQQHGVVL